MILKGNIHEANDKTRFKETKMITNHNGRMTYNNSKLP